jgi:hypothetical protein
VRKECAALSGRLDSNQVFEKQSVGVWRVWESSVLDAPAKKGLDD